MKKITDHLLSPILYYFLWVGLLFTFQYLYITFSPITHYVEYFSVEPLMKNNKIWEEFYMVSDRVVKKEVDISWNDVMICNTNNINYRFSSFQSFGRAKKQDRKKVTWKYDSSLPKKPSECYMISTITTKHNFWINKNQQIVSWPFFFQ